MVRQQNPRGLSVTLIILVKCRCRWKRDIAVVLHPAYGKNAGAVESIRSVSDPTGWVRAWPSPASIQGETNRNLVLAARLKASNRLP